MNDVLVEYNIISVLVLYVPVYSTNLSFYIYLYKKYKYYISAVYIILTKLIWSHSNQYYRIIFIVNKKKSTQTNFKHIYILIFTRIKFYHNLVVFDQINKDKIAHWRDITCYKIE